MNSYFKFCTNIAEGVRYFSQQFPEVFAIAVCCGVICGILFLMAALRFSERNFGW